MSYRSKLYNASMNGGRGHDILISIGKEADKELEAKDEIIESEESLISSLKEQRDARAKRWTKELEAKDKRLKHAEDTIKDVYQARNAFMAVSPTMHAESYLRAYDLIDY